MAKRSTVDTLATDIEQILEEYHGDVENLTVETVKEIGQKGVQALKSSSSVFKGTGKYKSGWSYKVEDTRMGAKAILYNSKLPGLPHLLEHGHAKRGGGRVSGTVHIQPVEDELEKAFTQELEKKI